MAQLEIEAPHTEDVFEADMKLLKLADSCSTGKNTDSRSAEQMWDEERRLRGLLLELDSFTTRYQTEGSFHKKIVAGCRRRSTLQWQHVTVCCVSGPKM